MFKITAVFSSNFLENLSVDMFSPFISHSIRGVISLPTFTYVIRLFIFFTTTGSKLYIFPIFSAIVRSSLYLTTSSGLISYSLSSILSRKIFLVCSLDADLFIYIRASALFTMLSNLTPSSILFLTAYPIDTEGLTESYSCLSSFLFILSTREAAIPASVLVNNMANSSPPILATISLFLQQLLRTEAIFTISSSPLACPKTSLVSLRPLISAMR